MPRKEWTEEERKAFGAKMKAAREAKQATPPPAEEPILPEATPASVPAQEPQAVTDEVISYSTSAATPQDIKSLLEGINEDSIVDVFNPLSQGFQVTFATSSFVPVNLSPEQMEARKKAGIPNVKDGGGVGHSIKTTVLPPNKTVRLPGIVAHRAITQLRNYLIAKEGEKGKLGDPYTMRQFEERIVIRIGSSFEQFNAVDQQEEIDRKIAELNQSTAEKLSPTNQGTTNGPAFPGLEANTETPGPAKQPGVAGFSSTG